MCSLGRRVGAGPQLLKEKETGEGAASGGLWRVISRFRVCCAVSSAYPLIVELRGVFFQT